MQKIFTADELSKFDGKGGRAAYVAFEGDVYDVTDGPNWGDGEHYGMHEAGMDLTDQMGGAPHGGELFKGYPIVGKFAD